MGDKLTDGIAAYALPILQSLGYNLDDLEFVKEGKDWYLRFYIEHIDPDQPVDIEDCQKASEALSDWLDEADPIPQAYHLEVSSPGIERPLKKEKDFVRFQRNLVRVQTYTLIHGKKVHIGVLGPVSDKTLVLIQDGLEVAIDRERISYACLHWEEDKE